MKTAFILLLALAVPAAAQSQWFVIEQDGTPRGDWALIEKCAAKPFPGIDWETPRTRQMGKDKFNQIQSCRTMLASRHAGWIAAGGDPKADPYPPQPMSRLGEDFKKKLVCDYSKLDKNGNSIVPCNDD